MKGSKILSIVIAIIAIIGGILFIRVASEDAEVIETNVDVANNLVSPLIYFSTYLFYASVIIAVVLSFIGLVRNPQNLKKTLGGVGILAVLLAIAYFLSDSNAVYNAAGGIEPGGEDGAAVNHWVGTGIWDSVILGGIASLFFVWDLVKGLVKS